VATQLARALVAPVATQLARASVAPVAAQPARAPVAASPLELVLASTRPPERVLARRPPERGLTEWPPERLKRVLSGRPSERAGAARCSSHSLAVDQRLLVACSTVVVPRCCLVANAWLTAGVYILTD
jgi:hypothetical protein